jgi:hypothetical protein
MAECAASLVADEVRTSRERLESTASALLANDVSRAVLDEVMPVTGLTILTVLDGAKGELLATNLDIDDILSLAPSPETGPGAAHWGAGDT